MLLRCFSSAGTEKLSTVDGKMDEGKHRANLKVNMLEAEKNLRMGRRFTFQRDSNLKHKG